MTVRPEAWVHALDERWRAVGATSPMPMVIEFVITGDDEGADVSYHLALGPEGDRALIGPARHAVATFRVDRRTADDIRSGRRSGEDAFLAGDLQLAGDANALIAAHRARLDA